MFNDSIIDIARLLRQSYLSGRLGGDVMPEDANPKLAKDSAQNYMYFTLPMALNYQRDSYALWRAALSTYLDPETKGIFNTEYAASMEESKLRQLLLKHKVALQPNKHCATWLTLSRTFNKHFEGDIRNLFIQCKRHVPTILEYVQKTHKKDFPYLSGPKICNYWLYVIGNYTDAKLTGTDELSIAPDTHVIQATIHLGVIDEQTPRDGHIQRLVNEAWKDALSGSELSLIDLHTPLWLWSRNGFQELVQLSS